MPEERVLLVAATGGHLEQMARIVAFMEESGIEAEVATSAHPQVDSLFRGRTVHLVPRVPPRGGTQALRVLRPAWRILRTGGYSHVISTGSGVAVPFFLVAATLRIPRTYVESAARTRGPSLSGRMVSVIPGTRLVTQHAAWADERWTHRGSVFDAYRAQPRTTRKPTSMVVTLGTMMGYPFPRAVAAAQRIQQHFGIPDDRVFWQVGGFNGLGSADFVPAEELQQAMARADLVVTHAGVGSCLQALEAGHVPIVLPRRADRGEHVDDHQEMIAELLGERDLAVVTDPDGLTPLLVEQALARGVGKVVERSPST